MREAVQRSGLHSQADLVGIKQCQTVVELTWHERVYMPRGEKAEDLALYAVKSCKFKKYQRATYLFFGKLRGRLPPYRIHTLLGYVEMFLREKSGWLGCRRQIGHDEVAKQSDRDADDTIENE